METQLHLPYYDRVLSVLNELSGKGIIKFNLPAGQFEFYDIYQPFLFSNPDRLFQQAIVLKMHPDLLISSIEQRNDYSLQGNINDLVENIAFELEISFGDSEKIKSKVVRKCRYQYDKHYSHFVSPTIALSFPVGITAKFKQTRGIALIENESIMKIFKDQVVERGHYEIDVSDDDELGHIYTNNQDILKNFSRVNLRSEVSAVFYIHFPVNFVNFEKYIKSIKGKTYTLRNNSRFYQQDYDGYGPSIIFKV